MFKSQNDIRLLHGLRVPNTGEDIATGTRMHTAKQTVLHNSHYPSHLVVPAIG